jgi:hypothetical protein
MFIIKLFKPHNISSQRYNLSRRIIFSNKSIDEGMTNGPSIFACLVFSLGGIIVEGIARPMKIAA